MKKSQGELAARGGGGDGPFDTGRGPGSRKSAWQVEHGIDRTYVSGMERGVRNPSVWNLARIAEALEAKPSEILKRAEELV